MVEGHYKAQGMDIILNKDISSHQGSSSIIKEVKTEMNIRVRGGLNYLKNKCCSSWGTTRGYYNSMNRNCLTWKLSSLTQMFQKNASASLKNLETQVGQLALNMPSQSKSTFPSDTQKNPKDCMAIQLRSGKDLSSNKMTERKKETEAKKEETEKEGEKSTQIEKPKRSNDQKKRKEYQLIHLQCHFHRDFKSEEEKNSFLNSWIFSRK